MKHFSYLILLLMVLSAASCRQPQKHPVNFYYWKSSFSIGNIEKMYFEALECNTLYLRFFDVDKEEQQIFPKAKLSLIDTLALQAEYVPVIFITNRTFANIESSQIQELASHILSLTDEIRLKNNLPQTTEIQIDCDWTASTQAAYFELLSALKKISGKHISCTVRLHQIKYREKTGIPPADKAYLMCYATSNPEEEAGKNSILDISLLKSYTQNINDYPLPFDIALPLYSWAVARNHLGQVKLINGIAEDDFPASDFQKLNKNTFEVLKDCFFHGLYLNKGFSVKIEEITPDLLGEAKNYLDEKIKKEYNIIYYHLDERFLKRFSYQELQ